MAVIGGEGGAEFIGAVRFWAIDEWFMGERILLSTTRFGTFRQREPHEGQLTMEKTEVRILYTRHAVCFGISC